MLCNLESEFLVDLVHVSESDVGRVDLEVGDDEDLLSGYLWLSAWFITTAAVLRDLHKII
jgi:hypothetical protein